jgi:hypothetical protein
MELMVGRWTHIVDGEPRQIELLRSGKINREDGKATWRLEEAKLILMWPNKNAPGGAWTDRCDVAGDAKSYVGKNQDGTAIRGTRTD